MTTVATLADLTLAAARTIENLTIYDGKVPDNPPSDSGIVRPYAAFYFNGGTAAPFTVSGDSRRLGWGFQVTPAAGTVAGALWAVDLLRATFTDRRLEPGNPASDPLREPDGIDLGPLRRDDLPAGPRWYLPMFFTTITTRSPA